MSDRLDGVVAAPAAGVARVRATIVAGGVARSADERESKLMSDSVRPVASELLWLEDLHVGQRFVSGSHRLGEEQIRAFAAQFDPQPFHLDAEAARSTFFGGLAASGWHTAAITMRLQVEGGLPIAGGIVGAGGTLEWPHPARPGDVLHVESEVVEITPSRSRPNRGIVTLSSRTLNHRNEVVQALRVKIVVHRRAVASAEAAPRPAARAEDVAS